jgi:hypothetical protein
MDFRIAQAGDGSWMLATRTFSVERFQPNAKSVAEQFVATVDLDTFLEMVAKHYPRARGAHCRFSIEKFGGCWKVRTLGGRLVVIYDMERDKKRLKGVFPQPVVRQPAARHPVFAKGGQANGNEILSASNLRKKREEVVMTPEGRNGGQS